MHALTAVLGLSRTAIGQILCLNTLISTLIAIPLGGFLLIQQKGVAQANFDVCLPNKLLQGSRPNPLTGLRPAYFFNPFVQFVLTIMLVWINQILFNAYVIKFHHGDLGFIQRSFGGSWFALDRSSSAVRYVIAHVNDGSWLAYSAFRVQAFLELPFIIFGYLTIGLLFGQRVYRALVNPISIICASISYTVALIAAELALQNRFTSDDVILRLAACVFVPVYVTLLERARKGRFEQQPQEPTDVSGAVGVFLFLIGTVATGYLLLASYDVFLLYNLRYLSKYLPGMILSVSVVLGIGLIKSLLRQRSAVPSKRHLSGTELYRDSLAGFLVMFFIPALSLRYLSVDVLVVPRGRLTISLLVISALIVGPILYGLSRWRIQVEAEDLSARNAFFLLITIVFAAIIATVAAVGTVLIVAQKSRIAELGLMWALAAASAAALVVFVTSDSLHVRRDSNY